MTTQSARKTTQLSGELSRSRADTGRAAWAMLAALKDALLEKNMAAYHEQSDADRARQQAERRREAMSWERHAWCAGDLGNGRSGHAR